MFSCSNYVKWNNMVGDYMCDKPIIYKELAFVYIVNGKKFLNERDAEIYRAELEVDAIYKGGFVDA